MMEFDPDELVFSVKEAVRRTTTALHGQHPNETLAGCALCTDDGLETLSYLAVTKEVLRSNSDPDLLFTPTDWPYEPDAKAFDDADARLRERASASTDLRDHVDRSFGILVGALAESRAEGVLGAGVFLSVLSTDPSEHLLSLEDSSIQRLNDAELIAARQAFIEKWR